MAEETVGEDMTPEERAEICRKELMENGNDMPPPEYLVRMIRAAENAALERAAIDCLGMIAHDPNTKPEDCVWKIRALKHKES